MKSAIRWFSGADSGFGPRYVSPPPLPLDPPQQPHR